MAGAAAAGGAKTLHIIHFNDVYELPARSQEPVGGAARFCGLLKACEAKLDPPPLVLFSGDAYNPSLLSTITKGRQMVEVLNHCGVHAACIGNHDFDYGVENFEELSAACTCRWLMGNVLGAASEQPLGGPRVRRTMLMEWEGVRVGLMGLVEGEWLATLPSIDPGDVVYLDFVQEARRLAAELRAQGAELVIALTHMRLPNDLRLAAAVPGLDLVLGGHDHEFYMLDTEPSHIPLVKSGTDFRDLTVLTVTLRGGDPLAATDVLAAQDAVEEVEVPEDAYAEAAHSCSLRELRVTRAATATGAALDVHVQRHSVLGALPEDPVAAEIVERYGKLMGERMNVVVGQTDLPLDGRFSTVRTAESNLGNLICDVWRAACRSDVVICNSGTFRSDTLHPTGQLTHRDLVAILPMMDETIVLEVTGSQIKEALENGVSQWPKLEGRFPQVSGIRFSFDPSKPPSQRVPLDSVLVRGEPLRPDGAYTLGTKAYLADGKDGYDCLRGGKVLVTPDCAPLLPTVLRNHLAILEVLSKFSDPPAWKRAAARMLHHSASHKKLVEEAHLAKEVSPTAVKCELTGKYVLAPIRDGRINCLAAEPAAA